MVFSCILHLQGKSKYKFTYPVRNASYIRTILSNLGCPKSQHIRNPLCPRVSQLFLPFTWCLPIHGGWKLGCSRQGGMALCVGLNVYLAVKQQMFRSHPVCQVQRRDKFQGSTGRNGSESIYLRVLIPLASASSHQHQLKQTFDWDSQSPLFPQDAVPLQAGMLVSIWCVHQECIMAVSKGHTSSPRQNLPHKIL